MQRTQELKQKLLTHIANRTFKRKPNVVDRLAMGLIAKAAGPSSGEDPELLHAENTARETGAHAAE